MLNANGENLQCIYNESVLELSKWKKYHYSKQLVRYIPSHLKLKSLFTVNLDICSIVCSGKKRILWLRSFLLFSCYSSHFLWIKLITSYFLSNTVSLTDKTTNHGLGNIVPTSHGPILWCFLVLLGYFLKFQGRK